MHSTHGWCFLKMVLPFWAPYDWNSERCSGTESRCLQVSRSWNPKIDGLLTSISDLHLTSYRFAHCAEHWVKLTLPKPLQKWKNLYWKQETKLNTTFHLLILPVAQNQRAHSTQTNCHSVTLHRITSQQPQQEHLPPF